MPRLIDHEARKAELVDAMWAVIHEQGISAVSLRTVAARAGVSVGSLRHLFPTRASLLVYAAELMIERVTERVRSAPENTDPVARAHSMLLQLLPVDMQRRSEMEINVALVAESGADAQLVLIQERAKNDLAGLCQLLLTRLRPDVEVERCSRSAAKLHALIDGMAFHLLQADPSVSTQWAQEILLEELQEWARRAW